jgi:protein SCO1/2
VDEHVGRELPLDAPFRTAQGEPITLRRIAGRGKPILLVFAYNRCTMLCNLVLRSVASLAHDLPERLGRDYTIVTISIDPRETAHEAARTQALVLERASYTGERAGWPFLVGERSAIERVASAVGFRYAWDAPSEQYAHPAVLIAVSRDARIVRYFHGLTPGREDVARALFSSSDTPAQGSVGKLLSCFRFTGIHAKYGRAIQRFLQGGTLLIVAALALTVGRAAHRRRAP